MSILTILLVGIPVIGVLVFVHELGHFLVAKWCGVGVVKFSIGFGPALAKVKHAGTIYQLSAIPLGGFVRMVGDIPDNLTGTQASDEILRTEESHDLTDQPAVDKDDLTPEVRALMADRTKWFVEKSLGQRAAIVVAGPLFNLLFAIILVWASVYSYGSNEPVDDPRFGAIQTDSPAAQAGLMANDLVLKMNDAPVATWEEFASKVHSSDGQKLTFVVQRAVNAPAPADGAPSAPQVQELTIEVQPQSRELPSIDGGTRKIYLIGAERIMKRTPRTIVEAHSIAWLYVWRVSRDSLLGVWSMVRGKVSAKELAGPKFIFERAAESYSKGFEPLIEFAAFLSISLAVFNLLPIPVLDGGHLLFFLLEWIMGPLSLRKREIAQQIGLVFLLGLMVLALHNDFTRTTDGNPFEVKWKK